MLHRRLSWSLFLLSILPIQAANFTSLYFFGDSLSDTGNVFTVTSIFNQLTLGLIPVQPESPPYYQGRFSNGPVWTETVAALRGMPQTAAPAGMSLGLFGSLPGTGNNYSIGGARTGFGGALGPLDSLIPTGVFAQTNYYLSQHAGTADPGALYLISGGANDLRDASLIADAAARRLAAEQAADFTAYSILNLYGAGARNFLLMNGPNVGFTPEAIAGGTVLPGLEASVYYNYRLALYSIYFSGLAAIELEQFDLFTTFNTIFYDTLAGGPTYGFTSAAVPCFPGTAGASPCDVSLFWDEIHPTTRLHGIIGNQVVSQINAAWGVANPEPATVVLVCSALAVGFLFRRRVS